MLQRALALDDREGDRRAARRDLLADQAGEIGQRPAELAAEGAQQRRLLLGRGPIVDIADDAQLPCQHVARDEGGDGEGQARDVDAVDRRRLSMR